MPYIKKESRDLYNEFIDQLAEKLIANTEGEPNTPWNDGFYQGDLNFIFFRLIRQFERKYTEKHGYTFGYHQKSAFIAALRDCADEYQRRFLAPYEDHAIERNGDV
jgi:hypothetical protein